MQRSEAATPRHAAATENQRAQKARQTSTPLSPLLRFVFPSPLRCRGRCRAAPLRRHLPPDSAAASRSPARALLSSRTLASTGQGILLLRRDPRGHGAPASSAPQIRRCSSPAAASTRHRRAGAAAARWWRSAARSSSSRRLQVTLWCRGAAFKLADSAILGLGALGRASRMVPATRSWV